MADIFISYSREDEARIKRLVSELESHGWSVFWDRRIPAGETWRNHIGSALQEAKCILVAWSKHSIESQWVAEEADEGKLRKILVPVLLDPVQPPRGFREIQAADISDWRAGEVPERFSELIGDIGRVVGKPAGSDAQSQAKVAGSATSERAAAEQSNTRSVLTRWAVPAAVVSLTVFGGFFFLWPTSTDNGTTSGSRAGVDAPREVELASPTASWLVVAGSFGTNEMTRAERRQADVAREGFNARIIDSDQYALLTPGLLVVVVGPVESREEAEAILGGIKATVGDAYVKKAR